MEIAKYRGTEIMRRLAIGGMGELYLARRGRTELVVKTPLPNAHARRVFYHEAILTDLLQDRNIVSCLGFDLVNGPFLLLEYIDGPDALALDSLIDRPCVARRREIEEGQLVELFRTYGPMLLVRARRIVGDDADDVVQEVFIKLMSRPPAHDELKAWLYRTCTNLCITRLRHRARRSDDWERQVRAAVENDKIEQLEDLLLNKDLVLKIMARMDTKVQEVATLVFVDEMSMQDAADMLKVTRKTVYNRLQDFRTRARKVLKRW